MRSTGLCVQLACLWEATARKPGNVHRYADFEDLSYLDFLHSAAAIAPVLDAAPGRRLGTTVVESVAATRAVVGTNSNLGIVLLLAPLAAVPRNEALRPGLERVLHGLDVADARAVYQAIRLARPGGLGRAPAQDVEAEPTQTLRQVMALAADRDLVARQYANGFAQVFDEGLPALLEGLARTGTLEGAIVTCHVVLLATHPDSLIVRKRGAAEGEEAQQRARQLLDRGWPAREPEAVAELDRWLRQEGHSRNPGTTADLVTASLFAALRDDKIPVATPFPWSPGLHHA